MARVTLGVIFDLSVLLYDVIRLEIVANTLGVYPSQISACNDMDLPNLTGNQDSLKVIFTYMKIIAESIIGFLLRLLQSAAETTIVLRHVIVSAVLLLILLRNRLSVQEKVIELLFESGTFLY